MSGRLAITAGARALVEELMARTDLTRGQKLDEIRSREREYRAQRSDLLARRAKLTERLRVLEGLEGWFASDLVLQPLSASSRHLLAEAAERDRIHNVDFGKLGEFAKYEADFKALIADTQCLVVQHDWARAFSKAGDYEGADFKLPYDATAFEFKVNGRKVFATAEVGPQGLCMSVFLEITDDWLMLPLFEWDGSAWKSIDQDQAFAAALPLMGMVGAQIKAISVALEAGVGTTEVVRAPIKLNAARARRGKLPLRDYHLVDLSDRKRIAPLAGTPADRNRPRLHFRRGHWRHFTEHKTWVRWTLAGNVDLGFIDKEYRL